MASVWVVEYDDTGDQNYVCAGVFSSKEKAEARQRQYPDSMVLERELDEPGPYPDGEARYKVVLAKDGTCKSVHVDWPFHEPPDSWCPELERGLARFYVVATSELAAQKKADTWRTALIESGEWRDSWDEWYLEQSLHLAAKRVSVPSGAV